MTEVNKNRTKTDEAWERLYARLDADGNLSLLGEDKEVRDGQYDIEPSDIFGGQLDYVTSSIGAWMK